MKKRTGPVRPHRGEDHIQAHEALSAVCLSDGSAEGEGEPVEGEKGRGP